MAQSMTNSYANENSVADPVTNTSNITVYAVFNKTSGEYASDNPQWKIYVNGSSVNSGTYNFSAGTTGNMTIGTWTGNVPHNTDGTGSCTWECRFEGNKHPLSDESSWFTSGSNTLTLTTINRGLVRIRVGGAWKTGVPYIRVGGAWKQGAIFERVSGAWKRGI